MHPLAAQGGMQPKLKPVAGKIIKPNDRLTSFERLEIYNRQYWLRLKDCFYEDYPGLRAILGERRFERLTCAYLERHPSQSFTLRNLGRRLVAFLEEEPRWIAPRPDAALDMARLEWAHVEAFDNEATPPLELDSLLGVDAAGLRLQLQPHLTLLKLGYELDEFLIETKRAAEFRGTASNAMGKQGNRKQKPLKQHLKPRLTFLAVHRHNDTVYYKRLEAGQFLLLSYFQKKATLAEACEALAQSEAANLTQLKAWFETWAALGWFCKLK